MTGVGWAGRITVAERVILWTFYHIATINNVMIVVEDSLEAYCLVTYDKILKYPIS